MSKEKLNSKALIVENEKDCHVSNIHDNFLQTKYNYAPLLASNNHALLSSLVILSYLYADHNPLYEHLTLSSLLNSTNFEDATAWANL